MSGSSLRGPSAVPHTYDAYTSATSTYNAYTPAPNTHNTHKSNVHTIADKHYTATTTEHKMGASTVPITASNTATTTDPHVDRDYTLHTMITDVNPLNTDQSVNAMYV